MSTGRLKGAKVYGAVNILLKKEKGRKQKRLM